MVRELTGTAQTEIAKKLGSKPVNIIEVDWNGNRVSYADRKISNIDGRIERIDNLDQVIKLDNRGSSGSVTVVLIDTDGHIKSLFDQIDLINRPCWLYQHYEGMSLDNKFELFQGVVAGPLVWSEGERTFTFTILTKIFSEEVGFSPEEGQLPNVPPELTGKVWPLCFGTPIHVPATKASDKVVGTTASVIGIRDPTISLKLNEMLAQLASLAATFTFYNYIIVQAKSLMKSPLILTTRYIELIKEEDALKQEREDRLEIIKELDKNIQTLKDALPDAPDVARYNNAVRHLNERIAYRDARANELYDITTRLEDLDLAKQVTKVDSENMEYINKYIDDVGKLALKVIKDYFKTLLAFNSQLDSFINQIQLEKSTVVVLNGEKFPQNQDVEILINGVCFNGSFNGRIFTIKALMPKYREVGLGARESERIDLFWIDDDTKLIKGDYALINTGQIIKITNQSGTTCQLELQEKRLNIPDSDRWTGPPVDTGLLPSTMARLAGTFEHTAKERARILMEAIAQEEQDDLKKMQENMKIIIEGISEAPTTNAQIELGNDLLANINEYQSIIDTLFYPIDIAAKATEKISKEEFDVLLRMQNAQKAIVYRNTVPIVPDAVVPENYYAMIGQAIYKIHETSPIILPHWLNAYNVYDLPSTNIWIAEVGATVTLKDGFQQKWIANILPSTVRSVYAYQAIDGIKRFVPVPSRLYTKNEDEAMGATVDGDFKGLRVTSITLKRPLADYDVGWDDQLYVTLTSSVGPNTVDQIRWIIENYTNLAVNNTSFDAVRTKIANYPSCFALLNKQDALKLIEEMAWQARCRIDIKNQVAHITYLSEDPTAIETITETDIEANSFEIFTDPIEDVVTKFVAEWLPSYERNEKYRVVLRRNYRKYTKNERTFDFFIYNIESLVIKSATFWTIRMGNMWKRIKFRTFLHKLKIETGDCITVNLSNNYVANSSFKAIVEKAEYDTLDSSITIEAWTPIVLGTMEPNIFAWPAGISVDLVYPTVEEVLAGNAGNPFGTLVPTGYSYSAGTNNLPEFRPKDYGSVKLADLTDSLPGIDGEYFTELDYPAKKIPEASKLEERKPVLNGAKAPIGGKGDAGKAPKEGIPNIFNADIDKIAGLIYSGTIVENILDGENKPTDEYRVRSKSGKSFIVRQQQISKLTQLPVGMHVQFYYDRYQKEYAMQMPTWVRGNTSTRTASE